MRRHEPSGKADRAGSAGGRGWGDGGMGGWGWGGGGGGGDGGMAERYAGPDRREGAAAAAYTPMLDSCTIACAEKSSAFCSRARPACAEALPVRLQMAMRAAKKRRPGGGDSLRIAHDFGQTSGGGAAMPITYSGISASRTRLLRSIARSERACVRACHSGWTLKDPSKLCRATMRSCAERARAALPYRLPLPPRVRIQPCRL